MNQLIERMLAVGTGLAPDNRTRLIIDPLSEAKRSFIWTSFIFRWWSLSFDQIELRVGLIFGSIWTPLLGPY